MAAASDRGSASRPGARGSKSNPSLKRVRRYNGCPPVPLYSHWTVSSVTDPALSGPSKRWEVSTPSTLNEFGVGRGPPGWPKFFGIEIELSLRASPPAAALTSFSFATAAIGVYLTTYMKSWQDFDYVMLVAVPMFLFSGTFYPLSVYPHVVGEIVEWTPLYQGVVILRDVVLGAPSPDLLWRAAYLAVLGVAGLAVAGRRIARLLLV